MEFIYRMIGVTFSIIHSKISNSGNIELKSGDSVLNISVMLVVSAI